MSSQFLKLGGVMLVVSLLPACASYQQQTEQAWQALSVQDWIAAEQALVHEFEGQQREKILLKLELGMLRHLAGDYQSSHEFLEEAKIAAAQAETISVSEELKILMTSPRQRQYRPQVFERLFIEYIQTLNFLAKAGKTEISKPSYQQTMSDARVMVRQMEIQLNDLTAQVLDYQTMEAQRQTPFYRMLTVLRKLNGDVFDRSAYVLRDNAWLRYVTGLVYEQRREWSAARVAYQQAAELYEQGYSEQMGLSDQVVEQAWFDSLRMKKHLGHIDWQLLATEKLSEENYLLLQAWQSQWVEVIQLTHQGWIPKRDEMNAMLVVNDRTKNMEVYPIIFAPGDTGLAQSIWFYLMYSDKGLARLAANLYQDGLRGVVRGGVGSKTLYLGPIWQEVQALGLDRAAQTPLRVTLPYYNLLTWPIPTAPQLDVNQQSVSALLMDAPSVQAVQAQLLKANDDFYGALSRAMIKRLGVQTLTQESPWLRLLGDLATSATEAAETRHWQSLPAYIHLQRSWSAPGRVKWVDAHGQSHVRDLGAGERVWQTVITQ